MYFFLFTFKFILSNISNIIDSKLKKKNSRSKSFAFFNSSLCYRPKFAVSRIIILFSSCEL